MRGALATLAAIGLLVSLGCGVYGPPVRTATTTAADPNAPATEPGP